MIRLGLLLHWYQPPWQDPDVLDRVVDECYRPLSRVLEASPVRCSIDLCWSLVEQLIARGHEEILTSLGAAARLGRIEFVETAAYHPILPLVAPEVAARQLTLNRERNHGVFHRAYRPEGVFPPGMAWSPELAPLLSGLGYRWAVTDDVAVAVRDGEVPADHVTELEHGLRVVLRSNRWSNAVVFGNRDGAGTAEAMAAELRSRLDEGDGYILLAMDAETFGHHRPGYIPFIADFAGWCERTEGVAMGSVSDVVASFPARRGEVPATSWSTIPEDLRAGRPFPLWNDGGDVHRAGWELLDAAARAAAAHPALQAQFDRGVSSCSFRWLSRANWEPGLAGRGFSMLVDVVRRAGDPAATEQAFALFDRILTGAALRTKAS